MTFNIQTRELLRAVSACAKVIQSKNTLAILDNVLLSQKDDVFTLTGANTDQRYEIVLESLVVTDGEFSSLCLPYRILQAALANLDDELIKISVSGQQATVTYASGQFNLQCYDSAEYPLSPELKSEVTEFTFAAEPLVEVVRRASSLTSNDELRPIMSGVCLDVKADSLIVVGSDGRRLFKYSMPGVGAGYLKGNPCLVVVPRGLVAAIDSLRTSEEVNIKTDGIQIIFSTDKVAVTARMIEGKYPNYNAVIPPDASTKMLINVKSLTQIVKRVSVFGSETNKLIVLSEKDGQVFLSSEDIDFSRKSEECLPVVEHNLSSGLKIGFNYVNLLSVLGNIPTENVCIYITDSTYAVKFKGDETENDPTLMILMPMVI